jgi:hypothetical protein
MITRQRVEKLETAFSGFVHRDEHRANMLRYVVLMGLSTPFCMEGVEAATPEDDIRRVCYANGWNADKLLPMIDLERLRTRYEGVRHA